MKFFKHKQFCTLVCFQISHQYLSESCDWSIKNGRKQWIKVWRIGMAWRRGERNAPLRGQGVLKSKTVEKLVAVYTCSAMRFNAAVQFPVKISAAELRRTSVHSAFQFTFGSASAPRVQTARVRRRIRHSQSCRRDVTNGSGGGRRVPVRFLNQDTPTDWI